VSTARGERKVRTGVVVSDAMEKTVVVKVERRTRHPLYGKSVRRTAKLHAHDEANEAKVGDLVRLMETRPLSATKRWRVVEIVERAK
jgi:small subunit ribosomal protein S17